MQQQKILEGVRLLKAFNFIESPDDRQALIKYAEQLAEKNRLWQQLLREGSSD
jgi:hypothetical protein